jgi:hypothetical protein
MLFSVAAKLLIGCSASSHYELHLPNCALALNHRQRNRIGAHELNELPLSSIKRQMMMIREHQNNRLKVKKTAASRLKLAQRAVARESKKGEGRPCSIMLNPTNAKFSLQLLLGPNQPHMGALEQG